ncbi:hypothetical protein DBIPINDM_008297 (plasmid) [Mesorhizobium sp. AR02]|uniref:hypothetical protein n=1 Tax=Mesorhizobium sp. AR02 TaxID=2865837 RepID=UPI00215E390F|nr:hypothetical protein [Mesorhizobium sp. AR02]UVK57363.1 hypothetical protein DBIPINDM_008297 [Mesorhizobium sp. AR02]
MVYDSIIVAMSMISMPMIGDDDRADADADDHHVRHALRTTSVEPGPVCLTGRCDVARLSALSQPHRHIKGLFDVLTVKASIGHRFEHMSKEIEIYKYINNLGLVP